MIGGRCCAAQLLDSDKDCSCLNNVNRPLELGFSLLVYRVAVEVETIVMRTIAHRLHNIVRDHIGFT